MPPKKLDPKVQEDVDKLEAYMRKAIEDAFPMMKVKEFHSYDQDEDGDLVGIFTESKSGLGYGFTIVQGDTSPILRRVA